MNEMIEAGKLLSYQAKIYACLARVEAMKQGNQSDIQKGRKTLAYPESDFFEEANKLEELSLEIMDLVE